MSFLGIIGAIAKPILAPMFSLIDKTVTNKDEAARMKFDLEQGMQDFASALMGHQKDLIANDQNSQSWLPRNIRPLFLLMLMSFIGFSVVGGAFGYGAQIQAGWDAVPDGAWMLSQIGLGGYITGRTAEKITRNISGKGIVDHAKALIPRWKRDQDYKK